MAYKKDKYGRVFELDASDVFSKMEEYQGLSALQKRILEMHMYDPGMSKREIADTVRCPILEVHSLFRSSGFSSIIEELSKQQLRELNLLAVKRIREALDYPNPALRIETAVKLLRSQGAMQDQPKTVRHDNKILVSWGSPDKKKLERSIAAASEEIGSMNNGNHNTVCASPETG